MGVEMEFKVAVFNSKKYDKDFLTEANRKFGHELVFFESHLTQETATLAKGFKAICVFVNDRLDQITLKALADGGTRLIALRCAGFNNVDLEAAGKLGITVVRVPAYSPSAVAEHSVAMILSLNRKTHKAYNRVREGNFSLDGLMGFDLSGKTVGIIGTGAIGSIVARILLAFGCRVLVYDLRKNPELIDSGANYVDLNELFQTSDIITLHCPLNSSTHHIINSNSLSLMKNGVMIINTGRGALIDSIPTIEALKSGKVGYLGLDVYEEEEKIFFEDLSNSIIHDDIFVRLLTFPNVLITSHQAFFTQEALRQIADTTLQNITDFKNGVHCINQV